MNTKTSTICDKWKFAVDGALRRLKSSSVRMEWKRFSLEQIEFLKDLLESNGQEAKLSRYNVYDMCSKNEDFVRQCLRVSLENDTATFWWFFDYLENLINLNKLFLENDAEEDPLHTKRSLRFLYEETLLFLIDEENLELMTDILSKLQDEKLNDENYSSILQKNSPILMAACRKDHFEIVRILVDHGCRLTPSYLDDTNTSKGNQTSWTRYTSHIQTMLDVVQPHPDLNLFEGGDEVNDLHLLRLMAKPSYILSCYNSVAEKTFKDNNQRLHHSCDCSQNEDSVDTTTSKHSIKHYYYYVGKDEFHYCPAHPRFFPSMSCQEHLECNDPIFRCFDLAKLAKEHADHVPEYRVEYEEIAEHCCKLSVQLLEQCNNTEEVQILLQESSGSSKYFRYSKEMKYPRLRLAIEHNHKEFVGHMFCQQILRQQWHGNILWQGKPLIFKFLHTLIEVVLAPLFVFAYFLVEVVRSLEMYEDNVSESSILAPFTGSWRSQIIKKSKVMSFQLDVPLNRFLIFSGYYLLFVVAINWTMMEKQSEMEAPTETEFRFGYFFLSIYAISMIWNDFHVMFTLKSLRTYFKFWRVFDLILHIFLITALISKLIRTVIYPYNDCLKNKEDNSNNNTLYYNCTEIPLENDENICHLSICYNCWDLCKNRKTFGDVEIVFLAITDTQAMIRLIYWLQLNEKVGPIVMNISRVILDIFSILGTYFLIVLAFTFGVVFVLTKYSWDINFFGNVLMTLFWTALDPGNKAEDLDYNNNDMRGTMATALIILYQVMIVIVLLNLLIAIMNSRIQKVYDRKQLYWKFARTSIWIEYFDQGSGIPIPFSIINVLLLSFYGMFLIIKYFRKMHNDRSQSAIKSFPMDQPVGIIRTCEFKQDHWRKRKNHAHLMLELIRRFNSQSQQDKDDLTDNIRRQLNVILKRRPSFSREEQYVMV